MRKTGNSRPEVCAYNILSIVRGEVAYERVKGVDGRLHDQPAAFSAAEAGSDAERQLKIFEPRISADSVTAVSAGRGDYRFDIQLSKKEGDS